MLDGEGKLWNQRKEDVGTDQKEGKQASESKDQQGKREVFE